MDDLFHLLGMSLFVEVARTGNFSQASRNLAMPVATLSRRIASMEREFGVRLFDRTTRRVILTPAGQRYFERCSHLVDEARLAHESLREVASQPDGHLRISMPVDLGIHYVGPLLAEFSKDYPNITFDLDLSPRYTDLMSEHIDVAIRLGAVANEKLVARKIGSINMALFAAPEYLQQRGRPMQPIDLVNHECILYSGAQKLVMWHLQRDGETAEVSVGGHFMLNNIGMMQQLAEQNMGVAMLPLTRVSESLKNGRLERVLPNWLAPAIPVHAVIFSRMQPASVRVLLDYLNARIADFV